jgi:ech hydrogenase subunit F
MHQLHGTIKELRYMLKMTPNVFANFFSKRATRPYPHQVREPFERARGKIWNEIEKCVFCGTCSAKCPSQCISVSKKTATWQYDPSACIFCGVCVEYCPSGCLLQKTERYPPVHKVELIVLAGRIRTDKKES